MQTNIRLLALDLHGQRFGFAVFDGPFRLLDWGVRGYLWIDDRVSLMSIGHLFTYFHPRIVTFGDPDDWQPQRASATGPALTALRKEIDLRSMPAHSIRREKVKELFSPIQGRTRHEIASVITMIFPELHWSLPEPRKLWESDNHSLPIFEAVAAGLACFDQLESLRLFERFHETDSEK